MERKLDEYKDKLFEDLADKERLLDACIKSLQFQKGQLEAGYVAGVARDLCVDAQGLTRLARDLSILAKEFEVQKWFSSMVEKNARA